MFWLERGPVKYGLLFSDIGEDLISRIRGKATGFSSGSIFKPVAWQGGRSGKQPVFINHRKGQGGLKMAGPAGRPNIACMTFVP